MQPNNSQPWIRYSATDEPDSNQQKLNDERELPLAGAMKTQPYAELGNKTPKTKSELATIKHTELTARVSRKSKMQSWIELMIPNHSETSGACLTWWHAAEVIRLRFTVDR